MAPRRTRNWHLAPVLGGIALAALTPQCILTPDEGLRGQRADNHPPQAWIIGGVIDDGAETGAQVSFRWHGADADGLVRWFEWAVDDTVTESAWHRTTRFAGEIPFRADQPGPTEEFSEWHTFFLRAVDDQGARSLPDRRFFNAHTIAPTSRILSPAPQGDGRFASTLRITWTGEDLDASGDSRLPAWFEYKLIAFDTVDYDNPEELAAAFNDSINIFLLDLSPGDYPADSLGDYFGQAQRAWVRTPGSGPTEGLVTGLQVDRRYAFAVRAIDEAGASEREMQRGRNWMRFRVGNDRILVNVCEPALGCEEFATPGFEQVWWVTVAPNQAIRFRWEGDASRTGSEPGPSNYAFDLTDPLDDSVRDANGMGGWIGWGNWTQMREEIVFPFSEQGKTHYFYLKMRDRTNLPETETHCVVAIYVARFSFTRKFLVIDDLYQAPKPCLGSPPRDEETDAFRTRLFGETMRAYLPPTEDWFEFNTFGSEDFGVPVELAEEFLEMLGTFQNTIWDCGSLHSVGFRYAVIRNLLTRYAEAGGNLLLLCDQGAISQVVGFQYVAREPRCPDETPHPRSLWSKDQGYLWEWLHLRGCVEKPRHPSGRVMDMAPQSMVRAEAIHQFYPDLVLSQERWACGAYDRGLVRFEGLAPNEFDPPDDPWYEREAARGGIDLLYRARTLQSGARTDGLPVAWRMPAAWADTLTGSRSGRIVSFAFHPYFFDEERISTAMTYALRWVVTGVE